MFSLRFTLLSASLIAITAARSCQCGFSVDDANVDPNFQLFTEYVETDFTRNSLVGWVPQDWSISPEVARGPYGKNASSKNVILSQDGLQLWVRQAVGKAIPMAEVDSQRTDMLYGSYRVRARMSGVNGTCGAMFWYHNNTQEIDMEFLSKQYNESDGSNINLVIQSPESEQNGYNAVYTPGFALTHLPFRPDSDFHEYRFDWTPKQVEFYADGTLLHIMKDNIPDAGGHMVFNHWSNGDPGWSAGPPAQDTFITISHAHLYFNSSDPKAGQQFNKNCPTFDATKVCAIKNDTRVALMPLAGASAKHRAKTIYVIIGVVIGLVIICFIGCMMTIHHWIALKNKLSRKMGFRQVESPDAEKVKGDNIAKDGSAPNPNVEMETKPTGSKPTGSKLTKSRK